MYLHARLYVAELSAVVRGPVELRVLSVVWLRHAEHRQAVVHVALQVAVVAVLEQIDELRREV